MLKQQLKNKAKKNSLTTGLRYNLAMAISFLIGIDEVGRGCLAGPLLVVAARQKTILPEGVADSKTLVRAQREGLFPALVKACDFGEGWVSSSEIDGRGLTRAMRLGVTRALRSLGAKSYDKIIMDGPVNYLPRVYKNVECLINADALVPLVSAASIYAKVRRDRFMIELAARHKGYGFENHVGYYTQQHKAALERFGPLAQIHRTSFRPVKLIDATILVKSV